MRSKIRQLDCGSTTERGKSRLPIAAATANLEVHAHIRGHGAVHTPALRSDSAAQHESRLSDLPLPTAMRSQTAQVDWNLTTEHDQPRSTTAAPFHSHEVRDHTARAGLHQGAPKESLTSCRSDQEVWRLSACARIP